VYQSWYIETGHLTGAAQMQTSIAKALEHTPDAVKHAFEQRQQVRLHRSRRKNERPGSWSRSNRVFESQGKWFFHTREGIDLGPYTCQLDAQLVLDMLTTRLRRAPTKSCGALIRSEMLNAGSAPGALNSPSFTDYLVEVGGYRNIA
jgi:hypothetical protein